MTGLIYILSFGCLGCVIQGSEVSFTADPQTVIEGLTNEVLLRCELHDTAPSASLIGRRDLISSSLSGQQDDVTTPTRSVIGQWNNPSLNTIEREYDTKEEDSTYKAEQRRDTASSSANVDQVTSIIMMQNDVDVAAVTVGHPARVVMTNASNLVVSGDLVHVLGQRGFLEVKIDQPTKEQVGEYQCEVNGVTPAGHAALLTATTDIATASPTTADLVHVIQAQQAAITALKTNATSQQQTIAALQAALEDADRAHLHVHLVGGDGRSYGAVLVTYYGSSGYVCDDAFDQNSNGATVVCRMLGFHCGKYEDGNHFTNPSQPRFQMESVKCTGKEDHLGQCSHLPWGYQYTCTQGELAGVRCSDACV